MNERDVARDRIFTRRAIVLGGGKIALLTALIGRLYYLQVIQADKYKTLAEGNRISLKLLVPPRGRIFDRNNEVLAANRQNFRAVIIAEQTSDLNATLDKLGQLIEITSDDRKKLFKGMRKMRSFMPIAIKENLSWEDLSKVEINAPDLAGVTIDVGQTRYYPLPESLGHVLGYVGAVSENELDNSDDPLLALPDLRVGKNGIEKTYDKALRGSAGSSQVEVNSLGRNVRELNRINGKPGSELQLTLDIGLQEFTRQRIGDQSAAAVLMDVHTGEILAMVSAPAFDPNVFSAGISQKEWTTLLADPKNPLINKTIGGTYAPGSTFKMTTALAALEAGVITPQSEVVCSGIYYFGNVQFHCWQKHGHGAVDLHNAIKQSCDCYFYDTAHRVGIDKLAQMARLLGFGKILGIDMPGERPGIIPDRAWKQANYGQAWAQGETLSCGIGQSYIVVTPLQLATMTARIANGGYAVTPHLGKALDGTPIRPTGQGSFKSLGISQTALQSVVKGMIAVANEPRGTAFRSRIEDAGFEMGGKTGSAQVRRITMAEREHGLKKQEELPWIERDNALYVAFAPIQAPRFACSVVVEHGAHGASACAPIARDLLLEAQKRYAPGDPNKLAGATPEPAKPLLQ